MKVLITRMADDASHTAQKLRMLGYEPIILPLFELQDLKTALPQQSVNGRTFDGLVFTSASPFRLQADYCAAYGQNIPVYTVGEKTAKAAKAAGFENVHSASGDGAALVRMIAKSHKSHKADLLHLSGEEIALDLGKALKQANLSPNITIERLIVYSLRALEPEKAHFKQKIGACRGGAAMFFSANSIKAFFTLARRHGMDKLAGEITALAISPRVAEAVPKNSFGKIMIAKHPSEQGLLDILDKPG